MNDKLGRSRGPALYYAIAALIAVAAIGLGAWFLIEARPKEKLISGSAVLTPAKKAEAPSGSAGSAQGGSAGVTSPTSSVSASDADLERLSLEAERDLAEIESALNEVDRIDAGQDNDLNDI